MKSDISEEDPEDEMSLSVNERSDNSMAQITKKVARNIIKASNERKRSSSGSYDDMAYRSATKNVKLNPAISSALRTLS